MQKTSISTNTFEDIFDKSATCLVPKRPNSYQLSFLTPSSPVYQGTYLFPLCDLRSKSTIFNRYFHFLYLNRKTCQIPSFLTGKTKLKTWKLHFFTFIGISCWQLKKLPYFIIKGRNDIYMKYERLFGDGFHKLARFIWFTRGSQKYF